MLQRCLCEANSLVLSGQMWKWYCFPRLLTPNEHINKCVAKKAEVFLSSSHTEKLTPAGKQDQSLITTLHKTSPLKKMTATFQFG